ncbi:MAG: putative nucleic acid-binding protein [Myxococcota bacterium]
MTVYVDSSALVKLLIVEPGSEAAAEIWRSADLPVAARIEYAEVRAALASAARGGRITKTQLRAAKADFEALWMDFQIVEITKELTKLGGELAEAEGLRGYDAIHLAAAITAEADVLATADVQLFEAAARQGLHVTNPA